MKTIAIIMPYFGNWPEWAELFFHSCQYNSTVDFIFFTDCGRPDYIDTENRNIHFHETSFSDYCNMASKQLEINYHPEKSYKLCDLRPFFGLIHREELKDYDFWGFGDMDLIWGDLRSFYTDCMLERYDILSTHADRISGHLTLLRNIEKYVNLPLEIPHWKEKICSNQGQAFDELEFTLKLYPLAKILWKIHKHFYLRFRFRDEWMAYNRFCSLFNSLMKPRQLYFKEQYTTPWFTNSEASNPEVIAHHQWLYYNGKIVNMLTGRETLYLHFLSLKRHWTGEYIDRDLDLNKRIVISLKGITQSNS